MSFAIGRRLIAGPLRASFTPSRYHVPKNHSLTEEAGLRLPLAAARTYPQAPVWQTHPLIPDPPSKYASRKHLFNSLEQRDVIGCENTKYD